MASDITLASQLCFALYAASRATQDAYRPLLSELGLTYPQYLVLLALWEEDALTVRDLGDRLHLDSGTVSPLLRRMEARGMVRRARDGQDGRTVTVHLTPEGSAMRTHAPDIQRCLTGALGLTSVEADTLRDLAHRLIAESPRIPGENT